MSQSSKVDLPLTSTKYRPIAELGRGGMATVYLTVAQGPAGFNKLQVLKRLRPALAADPEFLQMFLEEARLAARVNHPNVVQTNEVGYDGQYYYIAMEYLDGQPLEAVLRRVRDKTESKIVPLELHLKVIADALAGLHFAHELADFDGTPLNVVHRDMSPH
ncbi:MAG: serine/threonine protein kinase, partial [Polyangiaceae bacterium]